MRITQGMMSGNILAQLNNGYGKLADYQQQLASGKKITRPSQDPVVAALGIGYRSDTNAVDQYSRNVTDAYKWLDSSDGALSQANDTLQRIQELVNQASNDTNTPDDRESIKQEIHQLKQQLGNIVNTQVGDQYIFNGASTSQRPIDIDPSTGKVTTQFGEDQVVNIDVNKGIKIQVNIDPTNAFNQSLFDDLDSLENTLSDPNVKSDQISPYLSKLDSYISNVTSSQAELGAKTNRVDMIKNRLDDQESTATKLMSNNEDTQYEEIIVKLTTQQSVYNAALSVGAKAMQPTLVDFLR